MKLKSKAKLSTTEYSFWEGKEIINWISSKRSWWESLNQPHSDSCWQKNHSYSSLLLPTPYVCFPLCEFVEPCEGQRHLWSLSCLLPHLRYPLWSALAHKLLRMLLSLPPVYCRSTGVTDTCWIVFQLYVGAGIRTPFVMLAGQVLYPLSDLF